MADEQEVQPDASTGTDEQTPESQVTAQPDDRPMQNRLAEFNRKMTKVERQYAEMQQGLQTIQALLLNQHQQGQQAQAEPPQPQDTDELLWQRAQAGDRLAFEEYQRRIARREVQQNTTVSNRQSLIQNQMRALYARYPMFNDSSHPLTQTAHTAYQLMVSQGYEPGIVTLLEAAKTAIADRPDLVAEHYNQGAAARDAARRSASAVAQSGQTGGSVRQDSPKSQGAGVKVRPEENALAKRMGIADPKAAKERFLQRQQQGQSALGAVSAFTREEDF